jgi:beta-glucanase (GH16 family)
MRAFSKLTVFLAVLAMVTAGTEVRADPYLKIDSVPKIGAGSTVTGHIEGGNYADYRITMALAVTRGGQVWAPKPTAMDPSVPINRNGTFSCLFVTGGYDNYAETLWVYLIPKYFVPTANLGKTEAAAVDKVVIQRYENGTIDIQYSQSEEIGSGEKDGYKLVWEDLFNGTKLDKNFWNIEVNGEGGGNNEVQYYRAENVSLGKEPVTNSSCLILTAKKEAFGGKQATSGRINTSGKKSFQYGKIEARIKLPPTANGLWPAFWLLGENFASIGWPDCAEIDVLEMGSAEGIANRTQDRHLIGAAHWGEVLPDGAHPYYAKTLVSGKSLQDDFHLYTLIWDETAIKMFIDLDKNPNAAPYYVMNINVYSGPYPVGDYFHEPFHILLNLAIGGNFTGIWDIGQVTALNARNNYEAKMYVDFVKVYQKK